MYHLVHCLALHKGLINEATVVLSFVMIGLKKYYIIIFVITLH